MRNDPDRDRTIRRPWLPLLSALLDLAGGHGELLRHSERPWASVMFLGTRHNVGLSFTGSLALAAGERFLEALPEHEFTLPRVLVAHAAVTSAVHEMLPEPKLTLEVELLLLEDA